MRQDAVSFRGPDSLVPVVPKKATTLHRRAWRLKASEVWCEHGALEYVECVADDVKPGRSRPFPERVKLQARRGSWCFPWIVYRNRRESATAS